MTANNGFLSWVDSTRGVVHNKTVCFLRELVWAQTRAELVVSTSMDTVCETRANPHIKGLRQSSILINP